MNLHVEYRVKFRAFGITFGTIADTVEVIAMPVSFHFSRVVVDKRGVFIRVFTA